MKRSIFVVALLATSAASANETFTECQNIQSELDSKASTTDLAEYLQKEVAQNVDLTALFTCANQAEAKLPSLLESDGFLHGDGWVPNRSRLVRSFWGGKMFQNVGDETWIRFLSVLLLWETEER